MIISLYTVKGDPQHLLTVWKQAVGSLGRDELLLNAVATSEEGITIVDVCPTEQDFQGWINGDNWRALRAELGGDVVVTRLGELCDLVVNGEDVVLRRPAAHTH